MTLPLFAPIEAPDADVPQKVRQLFDVAQTVSALLAASRPPSRQTLKRLMTQSFGTSDAAGGWSMRDAYDALEAAQVLFLRESRANEAEPRTAEARFDNLLLLQDRLPTHSYRSEHQVAMQQFSTPLALSWLVNQAARIGVDDHLLEPSSGTGMLLAHIGAAAPAQMTLNERDPARAVLLALVMGQTVTSHDAEFIHDHLSADIRPSVILINPPFSRSEGRGRDRHAGARHLRSALLRLAPGGRCVAIMPPTFAADGSGAAAYASVAEIVPPRAEITILGSPYARHGTSIAVRLLLFDKGWTGSAACYCAPDIRAALAPVLELPPRLDTSLPPEPSTPVASSRPRPPRGARPSPLFSALAASRLAPPTRRPDEKDDLEPINYQILDEPVPPGAPVGLYTPWRLARMTIEGATQHPDQLVESLAMASVLPPVPAWRPMLQRSARAQLSDAQLETIIHAGEAFARDLPGTFTPNSAGDQLVEDAQGQVYRSGYFIGDGTGVGKGREGAGCILDQWNRGNRRAIWISRSAALLEDARRDWSALGGLPIDIQPLDAFPIGQPISMASGILFLTYATLRSARHETATRLQQILVWTGPDFEGVILFDESHAMGNAAGTENDFGTAKGSDQGLAGVRLQNALPRARIAYVSATGATKPENLSYASRLGLWGPGTAFTDRYAFMAAMDDGGIAAMEIVARDLKAMGHYTARALSFAGVEYEPLEHKLTVDQIAIYDAYADSWAIVHRGLQKVLEASNIVDRMSGATLNAQAKGAALSRFESAKQRFFSQLLISMKMPTAIKAFEAEITAGHAVVVQLVTTAEAILDRRLAGLSAEERATLDLDLSPLQILIDYLTSAFPTRQMRVFRASDDSLRSEPMADAEGRPVHCQEAIVAREALIEELCSLPPVPAALDAVIAHFGTNMVAEVTGRSRRIVIDSHGHQKVERRSGRANIAETQAFMDGIKSILVFSDAGSTGRSYHADLACKSADKRRIHFLLEPGWRADVAIQGLGRTHRTNQAFPPVFRPVTTDCKGERRFISTIARRLDSLGALTRGQRQTGGQNLFDPADNLESDDAREALTQWYHLLGAGKLASVTLDDFMDMTGLKLVDDGGALLERLPPIQRWLNRILALRIATQNAIFEEYMGLIQARVDAAREAGTLDLGVETIRAEKIVTLTDQVLRTDPVTGAETKLMRLELHLRPHATSWNRLMHLWGETSDIAFLRNGRSGRVALRVPSWSITDEDGRPIVMCQLVRPTGASRMEIAALAHSHWTAISRQPFRDLWEVEVAEAEARLDVETISVATGLLLPVWHKLPQDDVRVWRIDDGAGLSVLGRIIRPSALDKLQSAFGLEQAIKLSAEELIAAAHNGEGASVPGLGGARLISSIVNGTRRMEIRDFQPHDREWLKARGAFTEIIQYKTRLFLPPEKAEAILNAVIAERC
ncbi:strawberry notch-like NTP hydrolase domain-containing protein [Sphingobium sp.]|uniref:strawberry notch-like NTP hydrolase domain-containing protein n=1 Tax=Sphingobium sp. TaxID=1912891 RepID=UPI0035C71183